MTPTTTTRKMDDTISLKDNNDNENDNANCMKNPMVPLGVDHIVREIWLEKPGIGVAALHQLVQERCVDNNSNNNSSIIKNVAGVSKARVKTAKAWIPYRYIPMTPPDTTPGQQQQQDQPQQQQHTERYYDFVVQKIQERQSLRIARRYEQADCIAKGLVGMGVQIDDIHKTWKFRNKPSMSDTNNNLPPLDHDTTVSLNNNNNNNTATITTTCQTCRYVFGSRNLLFQHLRDPSNPCGNAIWVANGTTLSAAPSTLRRRKQKQQQQQRTPVLVPTTTRVTTTTQRQRRATAQNAVWLGDLPLPWTQPKQTGRRGHYKKKHSAYKDLGALLQAHLPRTIPSPWIKHVTRKAYRCHRRWSDGDDKDNNQQETFAHEEKEESSLRRSCGYFGFAIVVFRDEDEANTARTALDGKYITVENTFREYCNDKNNNNRHSTTLDVNETKSNDNGLQQQQQSTTTTALPAFVLKARQVENDTSTTCTKTWSLPSSLPSSSSNNNNNNQGGQDPPLMEQLRPLGLQELYCRIDRLQRQTDNDFAITNPATNEKNCSSREEPIDTASYLQHHQAALEQLVQLYEYQKKPRPQIHVAGRPIPESLSSNLLKILQNVKWPARNERPRLTAERYMVLLTNVKDRFYGDLRVACRALMEWANPAFYYSAIAVTQNFVASPHIDVKDQTVQYAVALGNFTGGGELCVEMPARTNDDNENDTVVQVIDTKNRIAVLDGRHVHWVRTWENGDRYSLIFYDTSERSKTKQDPVSHRNT